MNESLLEILDLAASEFPHDDAYLRVSPDMIDRLIASLSSLKTTERETIEAFDSHGEAFTLHLIKIEEPAELKPDVPYSYPISAGKSFRLEEG